MASEQEQNERFKLLLHEIGIGEKAQSPEFQNGAIEKLVVYKNERRWHFYFRFPKPLPYDDYCRFKTNLVAKYQTVCNLSFTIATTDQSDVNQRQIENYWEEWLNEVDSVPSFVAYLKKQKPAWNGKKLIIPARNETEAEAMKRRLFVPLKREMKRTGFAEPVIETEIASSPDDYVRFAEQKQKDEKMKLAEALKEKENKDGNKDDTPLLIGHPIRDEVRNMSEITDEERKVAIAGEVFDTELRTLRSGRTLLQFKITDYSDSFLVKMFSRDKEDQQKFERLQKGMAVKARGAVQNDTFVRDLVMIATDIEEIPPKRRIDSAPEGKKRVELHLHTPMSQMDAVTSCSRLIEQAAKWGHAAVAITDHGVAQSFPEAYAAGKRHGIKILYGVEANLVDDGVPMAYNEAHRRLNEETYIVFDVETTGLSAVYDKIIELAAVKVQHGEIIDRFQSFANPGERLSAETTELTGITDEMVKDAPPAETVLQKFRTFCENSILVAHNASFDIGFLNAGYDRIGVGKVENPVLDTLELGRYLYPELKNHRLNTLCKKFNIPLEKHHRAIYDAEATGHLLWKMIQDAEKKGILFHDELNRQRGKSDYQRVRPTHCVLFAKNEVGLKNLYKLISLSHINYFYREPRIPRSELEKHRDGLIVGSGCGEGELFQTLMQKSFDEARDVAAFYDYLEVQPPEHYRHFIDEGLIKGENELLDILKKLVRLGDELGKPVVATGDVHYLNEEDAVYRKILIHSQGGANRLNRRSRLASAHFRTTEEMLAAFSFLPKEKAQEIVIHNPNRIAADWIAELKPVPEELYTPNIEGADEEVRRLSYDRARKIYGDSLPELVEKRLEKELNSIIGHGFAVIYLISHKLVKKSLEDGYLVGSRGSVGSSFVATMMEITEVNPLPPHYVCPSCCYSRFFNDGSVGSGFDLPDDQCPKCQTPLRKDGHDIPFETFLGFNGDKVPDIDLNFSGEYQPQAHQYTKELFGEDKVFRAGTIGTVATKTAYGFVKGYEDDHDLHFRSAEIDRLTAGCTGVKRTTGQHPGGIIVVPEEKEIYDFCPIQYPADDKESKWKTTHFDFHSIHDNLLKLDILGHDDPTVIRMLEDLSGIDPKTIPTDDDDVMKLFQSPEVLGVTEEQIMCKTGTLGIPEFGTRFVRQMLEDTKPSTFSELVQISGLSHGTDVWLNNANELIYNGTCELKDVIGCRDDIMVYLIYKGLEPSLAFQIMEFVRKGKGLKEEWIQEMKKHDVPDWYIHSCLKIKYMFPKAHAVAYVLMAVRIAYFKVHYPILFYAAYFSVRAEDFDLETMIQGETALKSTIERIYEKGVNATPKEKNLLTVLEVALEMCARGYRFQKVDLYRSQAKEFVVEGDSLIPPFHAIPGLGTQAAINIVKAREEGEFLSKEDLQKRAKLSKTVVQYLEDHGCLDGLPEANQLSLF